MATISKGYTFGSTETVTSTKIHTLVDNASISGIVDADISAGANIDGSKIDTTSLSYLTAGIPIVEITGDWTFSGKTKIDKLSASLLTLGTTRISDLYLGTTNQGDILYDNGTKITRLPPGTSGQYLKTNGASANPEWGTAFSAAGWTNMQVFTSSGTWTKPANVDKVYVKVVGGGGNGSKAENSVGGGGGGGGGYSEGIVSVTGNVTVTVGSAGGTSSFAGSTTLQATGGSAASDFLGGDGGVGSGGTLNCEGQDGGNASSSAGGNGGSSMLGGGGKGGVSDISGRLGAAGNNYGGGGGGGGYASPGPIGTGGAGAGGVVIVYWNQ